MLAAQIASQRRVAGVIMLGSCYERESLRPYQRWMERASRLVPDGLLGLRRWGPLLRWRFAPLPRPAEACLLAMSADCPPLLLRRAARMIVDWPGVPRPSCPLLMMHGARDRFIPASRVRADLVLPDAGHAFTLTHAERTSSAIRDFLARLASAAPSAREP
jgi:pimeloyl-ACP methyl ester carboxylesterase